MPNELFPKVGGQEGEKASECLCKFARLTVPEVYGCNIFLERGRCGVFLERRVGVGMSKQESREANTAELEIKLDRLCCFLREPAVGVCLENRPPLRVVSPECTLQHNRNPPSRCEGCGSPSLLGSSFLLE